MASFVWLGVVESVLVACFVRIVGIGGFVVLAGVFLFLVVVLRCILFAFFVTLWVLGDSVVAFVGFLDVFFFFGVVDFIGTGEVVVFRVAFVVFFVFFFFVVDFIGTVGVVVISVAFVVFLDFFFFVVAFMGTGEVVVFRFAFVVFLDFFFFFVVAFIGTVDIVVVSNFFVLRVVSVFFVRCVVASLC